MLNAFAPPAASVPPTRVTTMSHRLGKPFAATIIVGTVVTSSSSMMRGFVRARYPLRTSVVEKEEVAETVTGILYEARKYLGWRCARLASSPRDGSGISLVRPRVVPLDDRHHPHRRGRSPHGIGARVPGLAHLL